MLLFLRRKKSADALPISAISVSDCDIESLYEKIPPLVMTCDGQLTTYDRLIYYWAANKFYSGQGTIVDGGALVGGSTCILSEGLINNPNCKPVNGIIHVYDLFQDDQDGYSAKTLREWYKEKTTNEKIYDFEHHFVRNTKSYSKLLTVNKGDISKIGYREKKPIEILSIDVAKTPALMHYMAKEFFPKLLTGHSIILHQDYIFTFQPWLHIAMEMMSDLVVKIYDAPTFCTSVFSPLREISENDVVKRLGSSKDAFFRLENVKYLYQAIEKAETLVGKILLTASLAYFHVLMGQKRTGDLIARRLLDQYDVSSALVGRTELITLFKSELGIDVEKICG
jgi:hypothetical protein